MRAAIAGVSSIGLWLLAACAPAAIPAQPSSFTLITPNPNASPTPTPFQPPIAIDTAPPDPTNTATDTPTPTATVAIPTDFAPTVTAGVEQPQAESARTQYVFFATLDFPNRSLGVDETIRYYNETGAALSEIVLAVQPNRYPGCFTLETLAADNVVLSSYNLGDQRLAVELPTVLQPGSAITLDIRFHIALPYKHSQGLFGYDFNQVNLVDWFPFVVPYSEGWLLHDPMPFGEHLVYDAADFELNLKTDPDVVVAASAPGEPNGEWTRYRLYGARTFALSASDEFLVTESAVGTVLIRSYYFNGYGGAADGILNAAVGSVGLFDAKFAPYPYESLSIVQADIHDGQEYDGLVFLATEFYGQYGGSTRSNLVTIGVHEIAHQWWFGLVGSDQALEPWLDEALSVYSERIYYEFNRSGSYLDWWWNFRVDFFGPSGFVDTTIYEGGAFRPYTNAVYLNGAHFLEALRGRQGDESFYRFIKDYAGEFSRRRASGRDFIALARRYADRSLDDLIAQYFKGAY